MNKKGKKEEPVVEVPKEPEIIKGSGEFTFPDESIYVGEWKEVSGVKTRDGAGTYTFGPEKYSGQWVDDKMEGTGEYHFASGAVYKGSFKHNVMEGEGQYFFTDGATYKGGWHNNKMHGKGVYADKDKIEYQGKFVNGLYDTGKDYFTFRST